MDRARYLIGLVTLLLAVAGGAYLVQILGDEDKSQYFRVDVEFRNVGGLLPGADVKYRGVQVGHVRRVTLRDDGKKGIAVLALDPGRESLACTNTKFWIVTPRFSGLTSGASGLETLVRDAYVSFLTPDPAGPPLANGSAIAGWEAPYVDPTDVALPPPRHGDLLMTMLVPENHGLVPGSGVEFRGIRTGEVRGLEIAEDGGHVRVRLRIDQQHRRTVTTKTTFWVARPRLSGGLVGGMSVEDVSALLVPFVSYYTEPGAGVPAPDDYIVAAEAVRPDSPLEKVRVPAAAPPTSPASAPTEGSSARLVQVLYEALEVDWFSRDDHIRRASTGVLYEDREGRLLVMTARSSCDGAYSERDLLGGDPDIKSEAISVLLSDGSVVRALRTWAPSDGADLALLTLEVELEARRMITVTAADNFDFGPAEIPSGATLQFLDVAGRPAEVALDPGNPLPPIDSKRGAAVLAAQHIVGLLGQQSSTDATARIVPIAGIPESLRPRP